LFISFILVSPQVLSNYTILLGQEVDIHINLSADASKCLKILRVQKLAFLSPIPKFFRKISVLHVAAHPFQAILLLLTYYSTFKWAYG